MIPNSSSQPNSVLLYTNPDYDDIQRIQQHIKPVFQQFELLESLEHLKNCLQSDQAKILIVLQQQSLDSIIEFIADSNFEQVTKILIIHPDYLPTSKPPFDFVLAQDDNLVPLLTQIVQFKQQQIEHNQKLEQRVHELEAKLSQQKQQTNQVEILKEAIVRNVSHELKTPLLHVKSAVSLMAEDIGKENKLIRYAENATARLETIVTNITMFGSSLDLNLGPVIVRDSVEYAHRNLQRIWESKEQAKRISLYIDKDLPPVLADKQGLSTILQLLLDNALKFSDDEIEVHAHHLGDEIEISVKDYGIGISKDQLTTIFDSFYQVDPSSTRRYGGTGVGLALVKLLIENHHSQIMVDSELTHGSTFSFRLKVVSFE